jgi:AAA domain/Primase C terminal 1 (PriCT-1)/RepB DNA-primase from phage plasmid
MTPMFATAPVSQFPVLDRNSAQTFLDFLDPDTDKFTFQTFTDSDERKKTYAKNARTGQTIDPLAKVFHGTLDEHWASLADLSRQGAGIFVTVNRTILRGRRNQENITGVRVHFADCDGVSEDQIRGAIAAIGLVPHIGVKSSEGKWHIYWCANDAPLSGFSDTQKKLSALFGSDPSVCDLPRVMRLPGFPHLKDGSRGELVQLLFTHDSANYSDAEFQGALTRALMARCQSESLAAKPDRSALPPHLQQRNRPRITEQALEGLGDCSPDWSQGYGEGHRNNECAKRAGSCLARGMSEEDTFSKCLQWDAEHNDPPLGEVEVRATVASIAKTDARNRRSMQESELLPSTGGVAPAKLDLVSGEELLSTTATPREWFVERFIPARETTMLGGDGGTGKTTLALQLSVAGSTGSEWLGLKVTPCNVLYISAEDPKDEIHFRLEQITRHLKITNADLARFNLIDLAGKDSTIAIFEKSGLIKPTPLFVEIEKAAREHKAGCIFFDAVADFFGGNENERREVRAFIGLLRGLALRLGAAVVIIAHPSVDGIKTGRGYSGSTHWNNAVRSRIYFTDVPGEPDGPPPDPDMRVIELAKSNRARRGEQVHMVWMEGRFVLASAGSVKNLKNETEA